MRLGHAFLAAREEAVRKQIEGHRAERDRIAQNYREEFCRTERLIRKNADAAIEIARMDRDRAISTLDGMELTAAEIRTAKEVARLRGMSFATFADIAHTRAGVDHGPPYHRAFRDLMACDPAECRAAGILEWLAGMDG